MPVPPQNLGVFLQNDLPGAAPLGLSGLFCQLGRLPEHRKNVFTLSRHPLDSRGGIAGRIQQIVCQLIEFGFQQLHENLSIRRP